VAEAFRVALIGGTSHVGKSTTAQALAARVGWSCLSTDRLARHPGRPWSTATFTLPDHVVEHYRSLTPEALTEAQLAHYRNMWPLVLERIEAHAADGAEPLVLEGSGVLPGPVAAFGLPGVRAVWLTAAPELIEARARRESGFDAASPASQAVIAKFIRRSQLYDVAVTAEVRRLGLPLVEVTAAMSEDAVLEACLAGLRG
jgi:2-phosphoglycerate kinase